MADQHERDTSPGLDALWEENLADAEREVESRAQTGTSEEPSVEELEDVDPNEFDPEATKEPLEASEERPQDVLVVAAEIQWHRLDHRVGVVLAHVNGQRSREEVASRSGLGPTRALGIIAELIEQGVLTVK